MYTLVKRTSILWPLKKVQKISSVHGSSVLIVKHMYKIISRAMGNCLKPTFSNATVQQYSP